MDSPIQYDTVSLFLSMLLQQRLSNAINILEELSS